MWRVTNSPRWCCVSRSMAKRCSSTVMPGCLRTDSMSARSISAPVRSSWWRMRCSVWPPSRFSSKRPSGVLSKRVPHSIRSRISSRRPAHDQSDGLFVAFARAADQRVADVFLESVGGVGYRADAALRIVGVALVHFALRHDGDVSVGGGFERERKACRAGTDNQKVGFHSFASIKRRKVIKMPDNPFPAEKAYGKMGQRLRNGSPER